ncbi:C-X-C motif chemokine 10 [Boleophthalmus pectinirostris]|uniref:C-X-C motif chemokine 10 n=1 Tax=Boleophthalmus pectinirostris TaxID=150288 RepID=UPI000A1C2C82|nr:C-X-C motif chemokine 10 [Boleophthalmus pectinirostris]
MAAKTALFVTVLLLCVACLHAIPTLGCKCIRTTDTCVSVNTVREIQVIPVSGFCRRTVVRIIRKNGRVVCVNPAAPCVHELIEQVQRLNTTRIQSNTNQL